MSSVPVKSVRKALELLTILAFEDRAGEGFALGQLADRMGMKPNSCHNLLKSMASCGYVGRSESGGYVVGPRCRQIGTASTLRGRALSHVIRPAMERLRDRLGEGLTFTALMRGYRVCVETLDSPHAVRVDPQSAEDRSVYTLTSTRILLSFAESPETDEFISKHGWPGRTWRGVRDEASLTEAIERIRRQGHSRVVSHHGQVVSMAVPVFRGGGDLLGALGCFAPTFRCDVDRQEEILADLRTVSGRLTSML
jgi:DNA-binding IclR family transcriptional regulator